MRSVLSNLFHALFYLINSLALFYLINSRALFYAPKAAGKRARVNENYPMCFLAPNGSWFIVNVRISNSQNAYLEYNVLLFKRSVSQIST